MTVFQRRQEKAFPSLSHAVEGLVSGFADIFKLFYLFHPTLLSHNAQTECRILYNYNDIYIYIHIHLQLISKNARPT